MRTNIDIDDKLMAKAMKASRLEIKTKKAVVEEALQMLVKSRAQEDGLRKLFGKGQFWEDYDYKAMRADESVDVPSGATKAGLRRLQAKRALGRNAA